METEVGYDFSSSATPVVRELLEGCRWGAPQRQPPGGFRAQSLLGGAQVWGFVMLAPRVALLTHWVGVGGISLSLEELSHQLAGLSTALSNPHAIT